MNVTGIATNISASAGPICFLLGSLRLGGIGRNALNIAEALGRRGHMVDFFLIRAEGDFLSQVPGSVRVFRGAGKAKLSLPSLLKYLNVERPIALISGNPYLYVLGLTAAKLSHSQAKIICTVHTNVTQDIKARPLHERVLTRAAIRTYRASDAVVAVSSGVADDVANQARIARDRIRVIYNPIVTPRLLDHAQRAVPCELLNRPELRVVIGAGRLTRQKDFPTLIRAFTIVRRRRADVRLLIIGDGEERQNLERLVRKLDLGTSVQLAGFVPDPSGYLSKASVFALSSAWEGFGNILVEAMAVGTPVVSTDCPSGPAEILDNGKYGRLVDVSDFRGMADAILATLADPPSRTALKTRAGAFTADTTTEQLLELIGSQ